MATAKQTQAALKNVTKAQDAATSNKTVAHTSEQTWTALRQQGAAVAQRERTGGDAPKTRAELYELAKQRDLPGRSRMGRDELARKLGEKRHLSTCRAQRGYQLPCARLLAVVVAGFSGFSAHGGARQTAWPCSRPVRAKASAAEAEQRSHQ